MKLVRSWVWLVSGVCTVVFCVLLELADNSSAFSRVLLSLAICLGAYRAYFDGLTPILKARQKSGDAGGRHG
jgi:hypothetical protein